MGRIFCHQCASKLDLDAIKSAEPRRQRQDSLSAAIGPQPRLAARRRNRHHDTSNLAIWLAASQAVQAFPQTDQCRPARRRRQTHGPRMPSSTATAPGTVELSEAELNAFRQPPASRSRPGPWIEVVPDRPPRRPRRRRRRGGRFWARVRAGNAPRAFTWSLHRLPGRGGYGEFDSKSVGHDRQTADSPKLRPLTSSRATSAVRQTGTEKSLLDKLLTITVQPHRAVPGTKPPRPPQPSRRPAADAGDLHEGAQRVLRVALPGLTAARPRLHERATARVHCNLRRVCA